MMELDEPMSDRERLGWEIQAYDFVLSEMPGDKYLDRMRLALALAMAELATLQGPAAEYLPYSRPVVPRRRNGNGS